MAQARRIVIPYSPRSVFLPFHERSERFAIIVAHRRCGKTVATINDQIRNAITCQKPEPRLAYIAPLFNQAKDVAWTYLKRYAEPLLASAPNETELRVDLLNGARIRLYGADNPDRLRGLYLDDVVMDEAADMHPSVWGEVIRPLLADRQGSATFIGTPKGHNSFHAMAQRAKLDGHWFEMTLRASETGIVPTEELDAARQDMTAEQYAQEFECSFEAAITGAYFGKEVAEAERSGRITEVAYDDRYPVFTAWDLGRSDSTAIWFWQAPFGEIRIIDFYENHGQQAKHYAMVLHAKPYRYAHAFIPHDGRVTEFIGDGSNRQRIESMRDMGLKPRLVRDHKIMDGINAARVLFPRMVFDAGKCQEGLECLRQYRADYDDKARAFKDKPKHDWTSHAADAFRYMAMAWREMREEPKIEPGPPQGIMDATFDQMLASQPKRSARV